VNVNKITSVMKIFRQLIKWVFVFIYIYTYTTKLVYNYITYPILTILNEYSKTVSKSFEKISYVIYLLVITMPVFMLIFLSVLVLIGVDSTDTLNHSIVLNENTVRSFLMSVLVTGGLITIIAFGYLKPAKMVNGIILGFLMLGAAIPLSFIESYNLYVYIIVMFYSIGAYSTTLFEFKVAYSVTHILYDRKTLHKGLKETLAFTFALSIMVVAYYSNIQYINTNPDIYLGLVGLFAYSFTHRQAKWYKIVYNHLQLDTTSRMWLFPTRVSIVYATGYLVLNPEFTTIMKLLFVTPLIFYSAFFFYATRKSKSNSMGISRPLIYDENMKNSQKTISEQGGQNPYEDLDVNFQNFNDNDGMGSKIELTLKMEIPKEMPAAYRPWEVMLRTVTHIKHIVHLYRTVDDEFKSEFDQLYDEFIEIGYHELKESKKSSKNLWDEWPEPLPYELKTHMYSHEDTTMDDISDTMRSESINREEEISNLEDFADSPDYT